MTAIYLSCNLDLYTEYPIAGFGYASIPPGDYVPPDGDNHIRVVLDSSEVNESPGHSMALGPENFSGLYLPVGYQSATSALTVEESGPVFGVYAYSVAIFTRFLLPAELSGEVTAFAKIECSSSLGVEYVIGGGAGAVYVDDSGPERLVEFSVNFHTNEADAITLTGHFAEGGSPGPEPVKFWTDFIGSREIP